MSKSKSELREWAKNERKKLNIDSLSKIFVEKLRKNNVFQKSKNIMLFYPLKDEVNLLELLDDKEKQFYLPRVSGDDILCCPFSLNDELKKSKFKTLEPVCEACDSKNIDLIIVPALSCDKNNYRLGYGGGYYDRFLKNTKAYKICCIPSLLVVNEIQTEEFDIKMDEIITEE